MPDYQPITLEKFANKYWTKTDNYQFTAEDSICSIVVDELSQAIFNLPVAFLQNGDEFNLVSIQGLDPQSNLCIDSSGQWQAGYIPACYRNYPFALAKGTGDQLVVCVDVESQQLNETGMGDPFFGDDGKISAALSDVINFQKLLDAARLKSKIICAALDSKSLIQSVDFNIGSGESARKLTGLHGIDEDALNALPAEDLAELRDSGALNVAYLQIFSKHQFRNLIRLKNFRAATSGKGDLPVELDLDFLHNHGNISFGEL